MNDLISMFTFFLFGFYPVPILFLFRFISFFSLFLFCFFFCLLHDRSRKIICVTRVPKDTIDFSLIRLKYFHSICIPLSIPSVTDKFETLSRVKVNRFRLMPWLKQRNRFSSAIYCWHTLAARFLRKSLY